METKVKNVGLIFHNAQQERPRKSGYYICCLDCGTVETLPYSRKHDVFNAWDETREDSAKHYSLNHGVVWWAEVPAKMRNQMGVRAE